MDLEKRLLKLGRNARQIRAQHPGGYFVWPAQIRTSILELGDAGIQPSRLEAATGIAMSTYRAWRPKALPSTFHELHVRQQRGRTPREHGPTSLTVITGTGLEITGLYLDQLERLLRRGLIK